jgi:hypothetical protein
MKKLLADLAEAKAFLTALMIAWGVVAANLKQFGVPVKVVSIAAAGLALLAFLIGDAISTFGSASVTATPTSTPTPTFTPATPPTPTPPLTYTATITSTPTPPPPVTMGGA